MNDASAMQELVDGKASWIDSTIAPNGAYSVTAEGYSAGGAIGCASGGTVDNVSVHGLSSVKAVGEVGGFIGQAAAGDVLGSDGVNLLRLVRLSGLLSVATSSRLTVNNSSVEGAGEGFTVQATGKGSASTDTITAGGFYGRASSMLTTDCHVRNLASVIAPTSNGAAGGFVGLSTTGGLASAASDTDEGSDLLEDILGTEGLLNITDLLGAVPYMVPTYKVSDVSFCEPGGSVSADVAGGFAGNFESGKVNVFDDKDSQELVQAAADAPWAVYNLASVIGRTYAGGYAGRMISGSLADAGGGLSLLGDSLKVNITELLNVVSAYVPTVQQAGVRSADATKGFVVSASELDDTDAYSGSAGGFAGYASGAQISECDVDCLRNTAVTEPADLETADADEAQVFFGVQSSYAVTAPRYAGGYMGYLNIGSAAGVGSGLKVFKLVELSDLTSALNVVASTIEHSDVRGAASGFAVLANGREAATGVTGYAGGFAGKISGGQIQDANCYNFSYVIGQTAAGGYAGEIEPGSVADVLGSASQGDDGILTGLLGAKDLATLVQSFVPVIRNSETTCVPCGGAVRAQALTTEEGGADGSDTKVTVQRGMAGGYVGHSVGGQIWGNSSSSWKDEVDDGGNYTGVKRESAAIRIRSVYGAEYAGGFTGLMESGDTASAGGLNLLFGLVTADNLLSALSVVYPTEENTAVYGPLRGLSAEEWNSWVDYVGIHGGYGSSLAGAAGKVDPNAPDDEVAAMLAEYVYGTHVVAGRQTYESVAAGGGAAGGYVGSMVTGTITNGKAYDTKLVRAMRAAGGFAGAAEAGAAATLGSVGLLNGVLAINLNELLSAAQIFVPVIKNSSVEGYRLGMTVESSGSGSQSDDATNATGNAGGYIGYGAGAQIWGDGSTSSEGESDAEAAHGCNVSGLRRVSAAAYAGGFAGKLTAGAAAKLNTDNASDGFLQQVLDALVGSAGLSDLVSVLKLSMSVVRGTTVTGFDEAWGYTVESYRDGSYPIAAGGYAGAVEATVLGKLDNGADSLAANHVERLRGVDGGYYAGGFVGLADVGGVADVASGSTEGSNVSILGLVGLNNVGVLQVFQPCIYGAGVIGVSDGVTVRAHNADSGSMLNNKRSSGNAGGFAGSVMSGTVQDSSVTNLNSVSAPSYTGGFIGYTGKSGVLDAEEADIASILGLSAEVINLFSTIVKNDMVTGIAAGYTVSSSRDALSDEEDSASDVQPISGGFIGFADLAHVTGCSAINLKRVGSDEIAGGFAGKTTFDYLVKLETNSPLVAGLLVAVNAIVEALRLDKLQNLGVIKINLGGEKFIEVGVLAEGNVAKISLFGLTIRIALSKESGPNREDVVTITIGDSSVKLTCDKEGNISKEDISNLTVNLIKANRAEITHSTVTGIADGYDVFGGGASQDGEAPHDGSGYAGGFVGHNDEGKLQGNEMVLADVVKGAANKTGTFTGVTSYSSNWWFNDVADVETGNTYHVYRDASLVGASVENIAADLTVGNAVSANAWARFDVTKHVPNANESNLADWQNATAAKEGAEAQALGVMASASKAVLMADAEVTDNTGGLTPEPEDGQDPCESSIDLTLQKIWDDGIFGLVRPSKVEFVLYATYTDEDGVHTLYYDQDLGALVDEESLQVDSEGKPIKPTVTVTKEDAESLWSSTWREVIESLPVATEEGHYYTYYVDEVDVAGYESQVTADHEEQVFTVTNKFTGMPLLPGTGGIGTTLIVAVGLATLVLGGVWLDQQRRRRNPPRAYAGAHFANAAPNTRRASKWVSKLHQKERMKRCKR
ncbi:Cna B-type domain-containing protein [Bifidobacterium pullorum]